MRVIHRLFFFSFVFFAIAANAQVSISPVASFDFGSPLFINRAQGVLNPFSGTATGTSSSESYGIGAQVAIAGIIGSIGLMGQLEGVYNTGRLNFNSPPYTVSGIDRKLLLEVGAVWNSHPIIARFGPWLSQSISSDVYENDPNGNDITPSNAKSAATHYGLSGGLAWQIPDFPLRPEINTHLDLTELSDAGVNAFSVGITLSYLFGMNGRSEVPSSLNSKDSTPSSFILHPSSFILPHRVRFLVNGSEAHGNPPLERVETYVKQYAMVDSDNAPPRVTQWVEESYHLPHLSLSSQFDRHYAGYLMVLKDSVRLIEKTFSAIPSRAHGEDTIIELDKDSAWKNVLVRLNTGVSNELVAELRTSDDQLAVARDTLVLPPADTSRTAKTIVKRQFRFVLSDNYRNFSGGSESLDLLLGKIMALLDSTNDITIMEPERQSSKPAGIALEQRIKEILGSRKVRHITSAGAQEALIVVLDR